MGKLMIDVAEAKDFVEANYQGDPLLRHLYMTLLDKLPKVDCEPGECHCGRFEKVVTEDA